MMKCPFGSKKCSSAPSAQVVDGKLILSLLNAHTPVVWQMDLADIKASGLEIDTDKESKTYTLAFKSKKENTHIASFESREKAIAALSAASKALERAHGAIRPAANDAGNAGQNAHYPAGQKQKGGKGIWVIAAILIVFLFILMNALNSTSLQKAQLSGTSSGYALPGDTAGVPLSADEFLRRR